MMRLHPGAEAIISWELLVSDDRVCDQKASKFFVSHVEESMAGHVDVKGVY
jgi:hypothetical protein